MLFKILESVHALYFFTLTLLLIFSIRLLNKEILFFCFVRLDPFWQTFSTSSANILWFRVTKDLAFLCHKKSSGMPLWAKNHSFTTAGLDGIHRGQTGFWEKWMRNLTQGRYNLQSMTTPQTTSLLISTTVYQYRIWFENNWKSKYCPTRVFSFEIEL